MKSENGGTERAAMPYLCPKVPDPKVCVVGGISQVIHNYSTWWARDWISCCMGIYAISKTKNVCMYVFVGKSDKMATKNSKKKNI